MRKHLPCFHQRLTASSPRHMNEFGISCRMVTGRLWSMQSSKYEDLTKPMQPDSMSCASRQPFVMLRELRAVGLKLFAPLFGGVPTTGAAPLTLTSRAGAGAGENSRCTCSVCLSMSAALGETPSNFEVLHVFLKEDPKVSLPLLPSVRLKTPASSTSLSRWRSAILSAKERVPAFTLTWSCFHGTCRLAAIGKAALATSRLFGASARGNVPTWVLERDLLPSLGDDRDGADAEDDSIGRSCVDLAKPSVAAAMAVPSTQKTIKCAGF
mmetsp:Transcript_67660/g.220266  ORF Transcript_67660/g.220266 Transcript_67660/m.220266 type:complete len:268 (+) Transcript_67660:1062-1865(+)